MKKLLTMVVALAVLTAALSCCAMAEETSDVPAPWYEFNGDNTAFTVRLPANATTGYEWTFEISDEKALELITQEYVEDKSEGMVGVGGTYAASFMSTMDKAGDAELKLVYTSPAGEIAETRVFKLFISENGEMQLVEIDISALTADWLELDDEECVLTVRLPGNATTGYEWDFAISDEETLELVTQEYVAGEAAEGMTGVGGTWVASFKGTFKKAGNVTLTLNYARSWEDAPVETRTVELFVIENNQLSIVSSEIVMTDF